MRGRFWVYDFGYIKRRPVVGGRLIRWWPVTKLAKIAVLFVAISTGGVVQCLAAEPPPIAVEIESPLASTHPLQGNLRQGGGAGPSPAVVLLHSCHGNSARLDERWGKRIASWGTASYFQFG